MKRHRLTDRATETSLLEDHGRPGPRHPGLLRVHPVPTDRRGVLAVAQHFIATAAREFATVPPELSEDGARFLASQRWRARDLAARTRRAVARNTGSLLTAADLQEG